MPGSRTHVRRLTSGELQSDGVVVLEMIGFCSQADNSQKTPLRIPLIFSPPRRGNFVAVVTNLSSRRLAAAFRRAVRDQASDLPTFTVNALGGFLRATAARSDHASYWRAGRKGIVITDTANFRNTHYHGRTDTADTLDYEFMSKVVRAVTAMARARPGSSSLR